MHDIEMHSPSKDFSECWQAAGRHLDSCARDVELSWLKASLIPPFLEHLSFRIANQLFFIHLIDVAGRITTPGNPRGLLAIAKGCRGHACLMPMAFSRDGWKPVEEGWGLVDIRSKKPLDPASLVTDENIEMTNWELQDFAVQVVRDHLTNEKGFQLMSSQGDPSVNPSLWFVGESGPEWVVVKATRFPELAATLPKNVQDIEESINKQAGGKNFKGHFASVSVANADDDFDLSGRAKPLPLWRGHGMFVRFDGLTLIKLQ